MFVDELDLIVTQRCEADLEKIRAAAAKINPKSPLSVDVDPAQLLIQQFLARYGSIFSTKFLLGGQLTASKSAESVAGANDTTKRDAMKWSAAASIESKYVSASVSGGIETGSNTATHNSTVNNSSTLAWNARGGNTLLAANPAEWANSVGSYVTWRTMEQDGLYTIPYLISRIQAGQPRIDQLFNDVMGYRYGGPQTVPTWSGAWSGRFMLQATNDSWMKWDGQKFILSNTTDPAEATIFHAHDAERSNRDPIPALTTVSRT